MTTQVWKDDLGNIRILMHPFGSGPSITVERSTGILGTSKPKVEINCSTCSAGRPIGEVEAWGLAVLQAVTMARLIEDGTLYRLPNIPKGPS